MTTSYSCIRGWNNCVILSTPCLTCCCMNITFPGLICANLCRWLGGLQLECFRFFSNWNRKWLIFGLFYHRHWLRCLISMDTMIRPWLLLSYDALMFITIFSYECPKCLYFHRYVRLLNIYLLMSNRKSLTYARLKKTLQLLFTSNH